MCAIDRRKRPSSPKNAIRYAAAFASHSMATSPQSHKIKAAAQRSTRNPSSSRVSHRGPRGEEGRCRMSTSPTNKQTKPLRGPPQLLRSIRHKGGLCAPEIRLLPGPVQQCVSSPQSNATPAPPSKVHLRAPIIIGAIRRLVKTVMPKRRYCSAPHAGSSRRRAVDTRFHGRHDGRLGRSTTGHTHPQTAIRRQRLLLWLPRPRMRALPGEMPATPQVVDSPARVYSPSLSTSTHSLSPSVDISMSPFTSVRKTGRGCASSATASWRTRRSP